LILLRILRLKSQLHLLGIIILRPLFKIDRREWTDDYFGTVFFESQRPMTMDPQLQGDGIRGLKNFGGGQLLREKG
jgi:hypothetical protein